MMQYNISLRRYNTFGIDAAAKQFAVFSCVDDMKTLLEENDKDNLLVLGGGSNLLFTQNYDGLVLKNEIKGIEKIAEDDAYVYVKAGAGENWHSFVLHCINNRWAGVENLSLIPGNVGASPMQNIGAYGVEIKEVFHQLEAYHIHEKKSVNFSAADCAFGYRESVFKRQLKGQFIITHVTFKLRKKPVFNTSYGAIEQELEAMGVTALSIKAISDAVIRIRSSKLPNPAEIGNAGSFFKNPAIAQRVYENLKEVYPAMPGYPQADSTVKLAAGWLIEQCGPQDGISWKGYRSGDAGCHAKQALVLVNYGNATGTEIYQLSEAILQSVYKKFGVLLEREVNIV
jgi:UDP-N-acetylmuramate dehydrogenase